LSQEHSYLVDCSKQIIAWIQEEGYSLLDVNLLPKPTEASEKRRLGQAPPEQELMTYLWDNYVLLSQAQRLILIGHGSACHSLMLLMQTRPNSMMRRTLAVLQVVGNAKVPLTPRDVKEATELRAWYAKHSLVILPNNHPLLAEKILKRHGRIWPLDETKPVKLIIKALPFVQDFIRQAVTGQALTDGGS